MIVCLCVRLMMKVYLSGLFPALAVQYILECVCRYFSLLFCSSECFKTRGGTYILINFCCCCEIRKTLKGPAVPTVVKQLDC
jgi:hypothetical protein